MLSSLRGYRRAWFGGDLTAALTLLAIAIPEQLATSRLAGMPPITGYYAFIAAALAFALFGSNARMSVGADSTIAPLVAAGLAPLAATASGQYVALAGLLAVIVGVFLVLVWALRLGWLAEFLSVPIITGFLAGVAIVIVVHQLPDLLGLPSVSGNNLNRLIDTIGNLGQTSVATATVGIGVIVVMMSCSRVNSRLPGALIAVVLATLAVAIFNLQDHGVAILGTVANGAPHIGLPGLSIHALGQLTPLAAVIALVVVSQTAATSRAFPGKGLDPAAGVGRDLLGVGAGNVLAGFCGAFPVDASPPRTAAAADAGGRSQLAGLLAALALTCVIPAMGLLKDLPIAALAGVLMTVAARIFDVRQLKDIARFDRFEFVLAMITLLTVALIGVEEGIGIAVALAIIDRARITARPRLHVLGKIPGSTSWAPLDAPLHPQPQPGVLVALYATPIWYANAARFRSELMEAISATKPTPNAVVLDAIGAGDIDYTGTRELAAVLDDLEQHQMRVAVARLSDTARRNLSASGLLQRLGESNIYPSVDEAVRAVASQPRAGVTKPLS